MLERRAFELGLGTTSTSTIASSPRRALRPARGHRRVPDAVREPGADRLRRAHLRARRRLRRRLDPVLVRAGHARVGRRAPRAVRRPGRGRRRDLRLHRAPRQARRRTRGIAADRFRARRGRRSPRRPRPCCARRARSRRGAGLRHRRAASDEPAHRSPPHACRRCRHRAARPRDHSQPRQRLLRRRRRPARGRLARACSRGDERLWTPILYRALAFLHARRPDGAGMRNFMGYDRRWLDEPHVGDHVGRSIWALGEILATAWVPAVVGPARDLLNTLVGTLSGDVSLRTAAYTVLGLSRLDSDRLEPGRASAARAARRAARATPTSRTHPTDWCWFEDSLSYDNARLSQALIVGGARARPRRPRRASASNRSAGSATSAGSRDGDASAARPPRPAPRRARARRRRRAAARRRRARRGRADRLRDHREWSTASRANARVRMVPRP